jgi:hypothetical protein
MPEILHITIKVILLLEQEAPVDIFQAIEALTAGPELLSCMNITNR